MDKSELALEPTITSAVGEQIQLVVSYTAEEEKRVVRKIDCVILPMVSQAKLLILSGHSLTEQPMCFVFFCQYLDKQSLSYASVAGLITDLKMDASQYSWCSSIFYIGEYFFYFITGLANIGQVNWFLSIPSSTS
jgi:hypothetical protein